MKGLDLDFVWFVLCLLAPHLIGLVEVAGNPGGVTEDEHHDDGQQQHSHGHVPPVPRGPYPLRS